MSIFLHQKTKNLNDTGRLNGLWLILTFSTIVKMKRKIAFLCSQHTHTNVTDFQFVLIWFHFRTMSLQLHSINMQDISNETLLQHRHTRFHPLIGSFETSSMFHFPFFRSFFTIIRCIHFFSWQTDRYKSEWISPMILYFIQNTIIQCACVCFFVFMWQTLK